MANGGPRACTHPCRQDRPNAYTYADMRVHTCYRCTRGTSGGKTPAAGSTFFQLDVLPSCCSRHRCWFHVFLHVYLHMYLYACVGVGPQMPYIHILWMPREAPSALESQISHSKSVAACSTTTCTHTFWGWGHLGAILGPLHARKGGECSAPICAHGAGLHGVTPSIQVRRPNVDGRGACKRDKHI